MKELCVSMLCRAVVILFCAGHAHGAITNLTSNRSVSVTVFDRESTSELGPWAADVVRSVSLPGPNALARAWQVSEVSPGVIDFFGHVSGYRQFGGTSLYGFTHLDVRFTLTAPTLFRYQRRIDSGTFDYDANLWRSDQIYRSLDTLFFNEVLDPGDYRVQVDMASFTSTDQGYSWARYSAIMLFPSPSSAMLLGLGAAVAMRRRR